ncbi:MAG TPA: protein kinase [Thermoanaerobaculia bacterium]
MAFFCINCKSAIEPKFKACPFCGEPITDFLRRYLDQPIDGKYQILSRLGIGGMGEVYKVLHTHLNAIRVIKLMRPNIMTEEGAHDRFVREARLATKIHHPNVATLYDFSSLEDGSYYMVWEYIEGTNLTELIRGKGCLSPRYAAMLAAQALHGLDAIHRAGVVHRDISPENLMILADEEGDERVKIIDLGIAKQWGDTADDKTKTGMFVGKWKYCSPEHLGMMKEGERIDGRADLYSFGIVLYELLTGAPPFLADSPHRYLLLHATENPRPLATANPGVTAPAELEAAIFKALEKERNNRFASAREFARTLEALLPSLPDTAAVPIAPEYDEESTEERASPYKTRPATTERISTASDE